MSEASLTHKIIGRDSEIETILDLLRAKRHVLLEGPVGSGKTSLAVEVADRFGKKTVRVDGDGRFTEQKLVGSFDPKLVLEMGFSEKSFIPGPLYQAMKQGSVLLINELNRMPEMVQNVLLPALDEGMIQVPNLGMLVATPGFQLIATQNPREFVGTSPLSEALLDRLEWISIQYLSEEQEIEIAKKAVAVDAKWVNLAVQLVRQTRSHAKIKRGASIRAALSLLEMIRAQPAADLDFFWKCARMALANRIELLSSKFSAQSFDRSLDEVIQSLKLELEKKKS